MKSAGICSEAMKRSVGEVREAAGNVNISRFVFMGTNIGELK
jgi:hypothetical protein